MNDTNKPLTTDVLKTLIRQCLEDFDLLQPYPIEPEPLPQEPIDNEDPPTVLVESLGGIVSKLKRLTPKQQKTIANRLGFHALSDIVGFIQRLQKAIKGK